MDSPRSNVPLIFTLIGLGVLQQFIEFVIAVFVEQWAGKSGVLIRPGAGGVVAAFIVFSGLLNSMFYNLAWLNLLDARRVRERLRRVFIAGSVLAGIFFFLAAAVTVQFDPKGAARAWAQVAVLVGTLAFGFRLDDVRPKTDKPLPKD
jgi:hypothetical protein